MFKYACCMHVLHVSKYWFVLAYGYGLYIRCLCCAACECSGGGWIGDGMYLCKWRHSQTRTHIYLDTILPESEVRKCVPMWGCKIPCVSSNSWWMPLWRQPGDSYMWIHVQVSESWVGACGARVNVSLHVAGHGCVGKGAQASSSFWVQAENYRMGRTLADSLAEPGTFAEDEAE